MRGLPLLGRLTILPLFPQLGLLSLLEHPDKLLVPRELENLFGYKVPATELVQLIKEC